MSEQRSAIPTSLPGPDVPVFVISVAAQLTGLHPQTLRSYDRLGLVRPGRADGGGRRYSWRDIERLREVARLTSLGIGVEGVRRILELENDVDTLRMRVAELESDLHAAELAIRRTPNLPALPHRSSQSMAVWRRAR